MLLFMLFYFLVNILFHDAFVANPNRELYSFFFLFEPTLSSFTYSSVLDYSILLKDKYNSFNKLLLQQYIIKLLQYLCQISKHNNQVSVGRWQMLSMQFMVISGHSCWSHLNTLVDCSGSACFYTCCPV